MFLMATRRHLRRYWFPDVVSLQLKTFLCRGRTPFHHANFLQMDEYNRGMDPEVKRYFQKIINSFSFGIMWLMTVAIAGLFFHLGLVQNGVRWYNVVFYAFALVSFLALMYYFYKTWSKKG